MWKRLAVLLVFCYILGCLTLESFTYPCNIRHWSFRKHSFTELYIWSYISFYTAFYKLYLSMEPPVSSEKSLSIRKLQAPGDGFKFSKILIASQKNDFDHWQWLLPDVSSSGHKLHSFTLEGTSATYPSLNMFFQCVCQMVFQVKCYFVKKAASSASQLQRLHRAFPQGSRHASVQRTLWACATLSHSIQRGCKDHG